MTACGESWRRNWDGIASRGTKEAAPAACGEGGISICGSWFLAVWPISAALPPPPGRRSQPPAFIKPPPARHPRPRWSVPCCRGHCVKKKSLARRGTLRTRPCLGPIVFSGWTNDADLSCVALNNGSWQHRPMCVDAGTVSGLDMLVVCVRDEYGARPAV